MNSLRNMKADILTIALGGGTKEEIQDKIDNVMSTYIAELSVSTTIDNDILHNYYNKEILNYEKLKSVRMIGDELLDKGYITFIDQGESYFQRTLISRIWVLK